MKSLKKIFMFLIILSIAFVFIPNFANAETKEASDEATLRQAIDDAANGDVISLTSNIVLTKPIEIRGKTLTINGNGNTVTRAAEGWSATGQNGTLITAGAKGTTVTLMNMTLTGAEKYGAQSYNGAHLILDNVIIENNAYGGVLVNAGTLEIKNVTLKRNRAEGNNGIELAKSESLSGEDTKPVLIMNGTLTSTETENVVFVAINDDLSGFDLVNTQNSTNKILMHGNKIAVTDQFNNILYESNEVDELDISGDPYVENITLTIHLNEQTTTIRTLKGTTLSQEGLIAKIDLADLNLSDYTIEGFFTDEALTTAYDFSTPFEGDTTLYAKLTANQTATPEQPEEDETPKTGTSNAFEFAMLIMAISIITLAVLRRKQK